jgi:uncharacterized membrane-anchored protein YhcB (DUF1043 family)
VIIFCVPIIVLLVFFGYPLNLNAQQIGPDPSLLVGSVIGGLYIVVFYLSVDRRQRKLDMAQEKLDKNQQKLDEKVSSLLEKIARTYIVRTCLTNLLDVFTGKASEKWNLVPDETTRVKFVNMLNERYIKETNIKEGKLWDIYKLASEHPPIIYNQPPPAINHDFTTCDYCKKNDLVNLISKYLEDNKNPLLD